MNNALCRYSNPKHRPQQLHRFMCFCPHKNWSHNAGIPWANAWQSTWSNSTSQRSNSGHLQYHPVAPPVSLISFQLLLWRGQGLSLHHKKSSPIIYLEYHLINTASPSSAESQSHLDPGAQHSNSNGITRMVAQSLGLSQLGLKSHSSFGYFGANGHWSGTHTE